MNTKQLIRRVRKAGRKAGVEVTFDQSRGKGSHGTLHYGEFRTIVPNRKSDFGPGILAAMLAELGLTLDDI